MTTFQEATDRLMRAGVQLEDMAEALGIAYQTIRANRLNPETAGHRSPPDNWRSALVRLARTRGRGLLDLADELETSV